MFIELFHSFWNVVLGNEENNTNVVGSKQNRLFRGHVCPLFTCSGRRDGLSGCPVAG